MTASRVCRPATATIGSQCQGCTPSASARNPRAMKIAPRAWAKRGPSSGSGSAGGPSRNARRMTGHGRPKRNACVPNAALTASATPTMAASQVRLKVMATARVMADRPAPRRWPRGSMVRTRMTEDTRHLEGTGWRSGASRGRAPTAGRRRTRTATTVAGAMPGRGDAGRRAVRSDRRAQTRPGQEQRPRLRSGAWVDRSARRGPGALPTPMEPVMRPARPA